MKEAGPNDPLLTSFVPVEPDCHFPIQNLPLAIFSSPAVPAPRAGVAIGEMILDLAVLERNRILQIGAENVFSAPSLNGFLSMGRATWRATRHRVSELLRADNPTLRDNADLRRSVFVPMADASLQLPISCTGYSDFMSSKEHSQNCVAIVGGDASSGRLWPNWHHLPMAYNGRAGTVVVSGTPITRPYGQVYDAAASVPHWSPTRQLDFELEVALVVGKANNHGERIAVDSFDEHAFGVVLLNDWSARDIQQWEMQPLGPFNSKNFATTISPWIVPLDALEPFRVKGEDQLPEPLPYLRHVGRRNFDVHLEASILPHSAGISSVVCRSELRTIYWSFAQQLAHQTSAGCRVNPGDLLGSGTISMGTAGSLGCLYEATRNGERRVPLERGETRLYLEDGDKVVLTGWAEGNGYRVGFGECAGSILPATA
jgi:fumarylacetoacetase